MTLPAGDRPFYREVQHFRQPWLWGLILGIALVGIWSFVQQIMLGRPFGNNPAGDLELIIITVLVSLVMPYVFYRMNLTTEVRADGIYYRFFPLHLSFQRIALEDIIASEAVTYRPLREYGGWGIRYGRGGKAYNVSGNRGVRLELSRGSHLLFGSRRPEEFAEAVRKAIASR
ncbi:MAG: DUF6141 family protein [Chloroflexota bacterium]